MKISILCPVKNEEAFLASCLNSVLEQTFEDWELILIDDHSTDRSAFIMSDYVKKDECFQLFENKGTGIIEALNTAYQKATGTFITRMDADDCMHPEKLQIMHDQLVQSGKGHIATSLVSYFADRGVGDGYKNYEQWLNQLTREGKNFDDIYKECVIPSPSWMMYKEDLEKINAFDDLVYPEDYHLVFKMYEAGMKVIPSDKVLHYWRDHPDRASRNDPHYQDNTFLPLKVKYFLKLDYDNRSNLVLWGAGSKGKKMAQWLQEYEVPFQWVCDNPKKWGHDIYGVKMQSPKEISFDSPTQVIVAVARAEDQQEIRNSLHSSPNVKPYFFC